MKPEKIKNAIEEAEVKAKLSHDQQTKVGAVLIDDLGATILSSYNGFIRGAPDAILPKTRPKKYPLIIHAEANLLLNAARRGIKVEDCTIVTTHSPCDACARAIWQAGITTIYFKNKHSTLTNTLAMEDLTVKVYEIDGYFKLSLSQKA